MRLLLFLLLPVFAFSQNILYYDGAEGTTLISKYSGITATKQTSTKYGITQDTSIKYAGNKSIRFELRTTDPEVQSGTRAEITFPTTTNLNRWYSYALYFPKDGYLIDKTDEVITQWHQGGGKTPALCLRTKNDRIYLRIMGDIWIDLGLIDKDKWHTYVMHIKHSSGSDGLIEIWRDNVKILTRTGRNMYAITGDIKPPNLKLGIYKSVWNGSSATGTKLRVLYFDEIRMGNENATYAEMCPRK